MIGVKLITMLHKLGKAAVTLGCLRVLSRLNSDVDTVTYQALAKTKTDQNEAADRRTVRRRGSGST